MIVLSVYPPVIAPYCKDKKKKLNNKNKILLEKVLNKQVLFKSCTTTVITMLEYLHSSLPCHSNSISFQHFFFIGYIIMCNLSIYRVWHPAWQGIFRIISSPSLKLSTCLTCYINAFCQYSFLSDTKLEAISCVVFHLILFK